jgi:predicted 3-demethylubiquinone-9 3-methyltransferase (glyoxalase superfamily)
MKPKNTICLWFDKDAHEAARFYAATPRALTDALAAGGAEARRAFEAMMTMKKIDVAAIEAARRG